MERRTKEKLAIYDLDYRSDSINKELIRSLYYYKTSSVIYITVKGMLWGIVSFGDYISHIKESIIPINTEYTYLNSFDDNKARDIFSSKSCINKIPVVVDGRIIGDYSRYNDDRGFIEWIIKRDVWDKVDFYNRKYLIDEIYIVKPEKNKQDLCESIITLFSKRGCSFYVLDKNDIRKKVNNRNVDNMDNYLILFVDTDEKLGGLAFTEIEPNSQCITIVEYYYLVSNCVNAAINEKQCIVKSCDSLPRDFESLRGKGVALYGLYSEPASNGLSKYWVEFAKKSKEYKKLYPIRIGEFWPEKTTISKSFFDELLKSEDYRNGSAQREILMGHSKHKPNSDYFSKYYNVIGGKRRTSYCADTYQNSIYMFGQCVIMGAYKEDKYTIDSCLQRIITKEGLSFRVVNCGSYRNMYSEILHNEYKRGDIIILWIGDKPLAGLDCINIADVYEENNIPCEWTLGTLEHHNHLVSDLIAHKLFDMIKLNCNYDEQNDEGVIRFRINDFKGLFKTYFNDFIPELSSANDEGIKLGCIVGYYDISPRVFCDVVNKSLKFCSRLIVFLPWSQPAMRYSHEEYIKELSHEFPDNNIELVISKNLVPFTDLFETYMNPETEFDYDEAVTDAHIFIECVAEQMGINIRFGIHESICKRMKEYNKILVNTIEGSGMEFEVIGLD